MLLVFVGTKSPGSLGTSEDLVLPHPFADDLNTDFVGDAVRELANPVQAETRLYLLAYFFTSFLLCAVVSHRVLSQESERKH